MSLLPSDDKQRKLLPIFKMLTRYFPKSMRELTRVCVANNVRFNPGRDPADIQWAKGKSPDQLGSGFRHILEREVDGKVFEDEVSPADGKPVYVLAEALWRIAAALEQDIEKQEQVLVPAGTSGSSAEDVKYCWSDPTTVAPRFGCDCERCNDERYKPRCSHADGVKGADARDVCSEGGEKHSRNS